ncbi:MAG TPA: FAD:protein FMN transferase [Candidatus Dormibacteraeota bacterium]|nr:FAD:protein FMN transferase [Candidatus Dormibacteraeota bacterium]
MNKMREQSAGAGETKAAELFVHSGHAMGTLFTIYLYAHEQELAEVAFEAAFQEIERIEEALSNYRASSELSRINRLAARQEVTTDPEVFSLIVASLEFSRRSGGAFDATVGPLMRAWGFFNGEGRYPTEGELHHARENVGWEKVQLDVAARTVHFSAAGIELDLGAIGKGYAVDRVVQVLREAGAAAALVDAGSSTIYAMDPPPGKNGWTVRIPNPADRSQMVTTVTLQNVSLSTSGTTEKFFELEGRRYSHVMDPRRGRPVHGVLQTTLVAADATTSDALSNAIFVMGPEAGKKLLATVPDSWGLWILGEPGAQRLVEWNWQHTAGDATSEQYVAAPQKERLNEGT